MLRATTIEDQLRTAADDPLRILIVGAGMAGATLAQLLRKRGLHPVLVERNTADAEAGYMLALLPLVDPLLAELELTQAYVERSESLELYRIRGRHGNVLREYRMASMLGAFGDYRGISRGKLLETLAIGGGGITYGATVSALRQRADRVEATFAETNGSHATGGKASDDGVRADFDLVVIADGLHSSTRDLVLDRDQVGVFDAGWGGWVVWLDTDSSPGTGEELWGDDVFVGTYPVKDRMGVFLGGPRDRSRVGPERFVEVARDRLRMPAGSGRAAAAARLDRALDAVGAANDSYYWPMVDARASRWALGRVLLLGDAAAGFLPTAGIGAGMAMESAWVLAHHLDEIDRRPAEGVAGILRAYEKAQRPRVEAAQTNSRGLARIVFRGGSALSLARDLAGRLVPIEVALKPIRSLLREQPKLGESGRMR